MTPPPDDNAGIGGPGSIGGPGAIGGPVEEPVAPSAAVNLVDSILLVPILLGGLTR